MKTLLIIAGCLVGLLIVHQSMAQEATELHKLKMQELGFMIGEWQGEGSMSNRDGTTSLFTQWERIEYDLEGALLIIHGQGWDEDGNQIHNAFGVVSYDLSDQQYHMNSFLENGQQTRATLELTEKGLRWWFETPQGANISYDVTVENGIWTEKGKYSPTPDQSFPFISFRLERQ